MGAGVAVARVDPWWEEPPLVEVAEGGGIPRTEEDVALLERERLRRIGARVAEETRRQQMKDAQVELEWEG